MDRARRISPFEYVAGVTLEEEHPQIMCEITKNQLAKMFKDNVYRRTEYVLLESLYRYPFLTRRNMEMFADDRLKDKKFASYENIIKSLWQDGCLRRFNYDGTRFYQLTSGAREYMMEKLDKKGLHNTIIPDITEENALEQAALAQWHLSLMRGGEIRKSFFNEYTKVNKKLLHVPSYLELERGKYTYKVISLPIPKKDCNMEQFVDHMIVLKDTFTGKQAPTIAFRKVIFLVVMVCASTYEMEQCAKILAGMDATSKLPLYFVAENNTLFTKGLDLLYLIKKEDEDVVLETISVDY